MKRLILALYAAFGLLLAATIFLAVRSHEGTVEEEYSRRGEEFLAERENEEAIGFRARVPDRLSTGPQRFEVVLSTSDGPLRGARAAIRAMRISGPSEDRAVLLREEEPGLYAGDLRIPSPGTWMLDLSVESGAVRTGRRWLVTAETPPGEGAAVPGDVAR